MDKRDEIELLIIEWLQSGNENTTHIADEIFKLFNPKYNIEVLSDKDN